MLVIFPTASAVLLVFNLVDSMVPAYGVLSKHFLPSLMPVWDM
jgi:hypothetical protein